MLRYTETEQNGLTHNHMGCPYWHQTGRDAVRNWDAVLAQIDIHKLPPDLQAQLQRFRSDCTSPAVSGTRQDMQAG